MHADFLNSVSLVTADIGASYAFTRIFTLDGGVRALWQQTQGVSFLQKIAYVGVTFTAPPTRL